MRNGNDDKTTGNKETAMNATATYTGTYGEQMEQYRESLAGYRAQAALAMSEAGVKIGDHVEYHAVGSWNQAAVLEGTLYVTRRGEPRVRLDGTRKTARWHKGFKAS